MTSTRSAAATGLPMPIPPTDRRTLLTGGALAAIVAASAVVPALAATAAVSPIEVDFREWRRVSQLADAAIDETRAAEKRLSLPDKPAWAPWSVSSPDTVHVGEGKFRSVLETDDENIAALREIIATSGLSDDHGHEANVARARVELQQILDWRAEYDRQASATGLTAAREWALPLAREAFRLADKVCDAEPMSYRDIAMQAAVLSDYWRQTSVEDFLDRVVAFAGGIASLAGEA